MDKTSKYYPGSPAWAADVTDRVVRRVAELPDRTSPQDCPEAMLVTADELRKIVGQESGRLSGTIKAMASAQTTKDDPSYPDDLRKRGWSVAVHNDYFIDGERYTFWLFTNDLQAGACAKGEGRTDAEALDQVRKFIAGEKPPTEGPQT